MSGWMSLEHVPVMIFSGREMCYSSLLMAQSLELLLRFTFSGSLENFMIIIWCHTWNEYWGIKLPINERCWFLVVNLTVWMATFCFFHPDSKEISDVDGAVVFKGHDFVDLYSASPRNASNALPLPISRRWSPQDNSIARHKRTLRDHVVWVGVSLKITPSFFTEE